MIRICVEVRRKDFHQRAEKEAYLGCLVKKLRVRGVVFRQRAEKGAYLERLAKIRREPDCHYTSYQK